MVYKVSYVVIGRSHPGAILNQEAPPRLGEVMELGGRKYRIVEVTDLMPPRGDFAYLHVALRPLAEAEEI
jgi:hypothetical protein